MLKSPVITLSKLNKALYDVQNEFYLLGLWNEGSPLKEIEIYLCSRPRILYQGFFMHGASKWDSFEGYFEGKLYISKYCLLNLFKSKYSSIRDLIRHEYAHGFAEKYQNLIYGKAFEIAFSGTYDSGVKTKMPVETYFTNYAREFPMEDFAETFKLYLKWKGKLPKKFTDKKLIVKWDFVANVIKKASRT
jgi:hypothetical protein